VWRTHLKRLVHPLSGSTTWAEYDGTTTVRPVWDGRANLVELEVNGPAGHIEGMSLRLYNPKSHQWSLNFPHSGLATMDSPPFARARDLQRPAYWEAHCLFRPSSPSR